MGTLLTTQPLPLLLLLLKLLTLHFLLPPSHSISDELGEEIRDYVEELFATGPTKAPTKKIFQKQVIIDSSIELDSPYYCYAEAMRKSVHNRLYCKREHFFLKVAYEELEQSCSQTFVACKNGVKRCLRSTRVIEGVYCNLTSGTIVPGCEYDSLYMKGYVLFTCRWQDEICRLAPDDIDSILEISGEQ